MNNALPPYVFLPTGLFLAKLIAHKEGEDRSKWVTDFAVQLVEGAGRDDFARSLIDTAVIKQNAAMNRVRRSRAKSELISEGVKNPTRQQIEERLKEIYAEEEITAAAATREGAEVVDSRESGAAVPTTVSRNMRRVPQNEAPAHGFSGGRTAQGTMSRSPEAAAQSGKAYDQEAAKTRDTRDNSRGHYAPPSCSPEDGNPAETAPSHGGSVASLEARKGQARESQPGAGEVPPESASAKPSPALPVPAKKAHGEFGNVLLTDDEFAKLQEKTPNAWDLITELDQYIESQGKTKKYKSHYATLLNWSRRKAQESKPKKGYMTSDDISKKNYQESKARLEAMFAKGRKTA